MYHEKPDPNVCPSCGAENSIRELDKPTRWQPVTMGYDADGLLIPVDYEEWHVSDDGEHEGYECGECYDQWPTNYALAADQRLAKALTDHRDFWETRSARHQILAEAGRADYVNVNEKIAEANGRAEAFAYTLAILRGNGEA